MKESVGYTVTLNIVIVFIIIVFTFLSTALIYFKSNKVSNIITGAIEKYEGNEQAKSEIKLKLSSIGYNSKAVDCNAYYKRVDFKLKDGKIENGECKKNSILSDENTGYCVFLCEEYIEEEDAYYYYYKVSTNLMFNVPIVNELLNIPIFSNTNRLYDFERNLP